MLSAEAERMTNKLEVIARNQFAGNAESHFDFQKRVTKDLIDLSRMVRDLARIAQGSPSGEGGFR